MMLRIRADINFINVHGNCNQTTHHCYCFVFSFVRQKHIFGKFPIHIKVGPLPLMFPQQQHELPAETCDGILPQTVYCEMQTVWTFSLGKYMFLVDDFPSLFQILGGSFNYVSFVGIPNLLSGEVLSLNWTAIPYTEAEDPQCGRPSSVPFAASLSALISCNATFPKNK